MKSICIDVDGVLAQYDGWKGIFHFGDPFPRAVEFTKKLSEKYRVVIFTCRCNYELNAKEYYESDEYSNRADSLSEDEVIEELKQLVAEYLLKHCFYYHEIYTGQGKPSAIAYIDDRAIQYADAEGCDFDAILNHLN